MANALVRPVLYRLTIAGAYAVVTVLAGEVRQAPLGYRWAIGRRKEDVFRWVRARGGLVERVETAAAKGGGR